MDYILPIVCIAILLFGLVVGIASAGHAILPEPPEEADWDEEELQRYITFFSGDWVDENDEN